jgi:hypothetical protein
MRSEGHMDMDCRLTFFVVRAHASETIQGVAYILSLQQLSALVHLHRQYLQQISDLIKIRQ